jgi:hypothetical protein
MGVWDGYEWFWYLSWFRPLRGRNFDLSYQLYVILSKVNLDKDKEDRLVWKDNFTDKFIVKSLRGLLSSCPSMDTIFSFAGIWNGIIPPKI